MAITMRKGLSADFDPNKMIAGEWAVTIDSDTQHQIVYMCFAAGIVKRMGTLDDFELWFKAEIAPYEQEFIDLRNECKTLRNEVLSVHDDIMDAYELSKLIPSYVAETKTYKEFVENAVNMNIPQFDLDFVTGQLMYQGGMFHWAILNDGQLAWEV